MNDNPGGDAAEGVILFFDDSYNTRWVLVRPGESISFTQSNWPYFYAGIPYHEANGVPSMTGQFTLTVSSSGGTNGTYAITRDHVAIIKEPQFTRACWLPVASHASGANNSQWRTDLGLLNTGGSAANFELRFTSGGTLRTNTAYVPAGAQSILIDVVGQLGTSGSGSLEVRSDQPLKVTSRTYNQSSSGTFGQNYPSYLTSEGLSAGQSAFLPQLTENSSYRCNIALTNTGALSASVRVELFDGAGGKLTEYTVNLQPAEWKQENQPFRNKAGQTNMSRGYAKVTVLSGSGVIATASVVDGNTNDPTTVEMIH